MCFNAKSYDALATIANKDIKVYKVLGLDEGVLTSVLKDHRWVAGTEYKEPRFERITKNWTKDLDYGFHSYRTLEIAKKNRKLWGAQSKIYEMKIPRGSLYFMNSEQIISDSMILVSNKPARAPRTVKATVNGKGKTKRKAK